MPVLAIETAAFESAVREGANALAGGAAWKARLHTLLRGLTESKPDQARTQACYQAEAKKGKNMLN